MGDSVFGVVMTAVLGQGAFGELATVAERDAACVPEGLDMATAGVLGLAGATAHGMIGAVSPGEGDHVLISGATGGVGGLAVQLAAARGARVIATTQSDDADRVRHSVPLTPSTTPAISPLRSGRCARTVWMPLCTWPATGRRWLSCSAPMGASSRRSVSAKTR